MKVWILQNQMRTEKQMRAAALRHRFFFLALYKIQIWIIIDSKTVENQGLFVHNNFTVSL